MCTTELVWIGHQQEQHEWLKSYNFWDFLYIWLVLFTYSIAFYLVYNKISIIEISYFAKVVKIIEISYLLQFLFIKHVKASY